MPRASIWTWLSLGFTSATVCIAASCGGNSSTSPIGASTGASIGSTSVATTFGATPADPGRCFQPGSDPACLAAARVGRSLVVRAAAVPPNAPTGLTQSVTGAVVTLTWVAPTSGTPPATYIVEAGSSSGLANLANFSTGNTTTTITVGAVPPGVYFVRVRAGSSAGDISAPSNEVSLTVAGFSPPSSCTTPTGPPYGLIARVSGNYVLLSWVAPLSAPCGVTEYLVEAGSDRGLADLANVATGNTTTYYQAFNVPVGLYYVRIRARGGGGTSVASSDVALSVASPSGIPDVHGFWDGSSPDGFFGSDSACGSRDYNFDLQLTQSGTLVHGTAAKTRRSRLPGTGCDVAVTYQLDGTIGAGGVMRFTLQGGGSGTITCSGPFTDLLASGECTGPNSLTVRFTLRR